MASPINAPATHQGSERVNDPGAQLPTITCANRGELTLISPTLVQTCYGERAGQAPRVAGLDQPLDTVVAGGVKYAIAVEHLVKFRFADEGNPITKTQQVHMCGNSVSPPPMAALARANDPWRAIERQAVAALLPYAEQSV